MDPIISNGVRKDEDNFDCNKDAGIYECPAGDIEKRKAI